MKLSRQCLSCAAALFVAVLVTQPALAQWKLVGVSGDHEAGDFYPGLSVDHEVLFEIDISDGSVEKIRDVRNDVDAELLAAGWGDDIINEPLFGIGFRRGMGLAYNSDAGELVIRNGRAGTGGSVEDQLSYDTRLIEAYDPGSTGNFTTAPTPFYNALLSSGTGVPVLGTDPAFPIDATFYPESRGFIWNPRDKNYIIANSNGSSIGTMDPNTFVATEVATNLNNEFRGLAWYDSTLDGDASTGLQRIFAFDKSNAPNALYELDSDSGSGTYLQENAFFAGIDLLNAPTPMDAEVVKAVALAQHPGTGDLYGIVEVSGLVPDSEARHLIRFDMADLTAPLPLFINATYVGPQGDGFVIEGEPTRKITSIAFIPVQDALLGDCNLDGVVDAADLECVATIPERDIVLGALNTLPGDLNGNGDVAFADFLVLSSNFGTALSKYTEGNIDLQNDGVAFGDFLILSANFGKVPAAGGATAAAVPEPSTAMLLVVGLLSLFRRRWIVSKKVWLR